MAHRLEYVVPQFVPDRVVELLQTVGVHPLDLLQNLRPVLLGVAIRVVYVKLGQLLVELVTSEASREGGCIDCVRNSKIRRERCEERSDEAL